MYETLEREVIPTFYERPNRWLAMSRAAIEMAERQFTSNRMVEEYFDKIYRPLDRLRREG